MIIATSFDCIDAEILNNRALNYGDGLFETMRMHQGGIPLFDMHMSRLAKGLKRLGLEPMNSVKILDSIQLNCPAELAASCVVKLVLFRAGQKRGYGPQTHQTEWYLSASDIKISNHETPLKLAVAKNKMAIQPMLAGIKHLSRLEQVLLAAELSEYDAVDDLLVLNMEDKVIETTNKNLIFIKGEQLITPSLKQCGVKGVALKWLKSKYKVKSKKIKISHVSVFDGLMVCNSVKGFQAVSSVAGKPLKDVISFSTSLPIQDKITKQWEAQYNS